MLYIAEVQLTYTPKLKRSQLPKISGSEQAYKVLAQHWDQGKINLLEQFFIMLLNRENRLLGIFEASKGGLSETVVDQRLIFTAALKGCASSIILAHNHPSGNLTPSTADLTITKRLVEAGTLLGIPVIDHIIMTAEGYLSFADDGLL